MYGENIDKPSTLRGPGTEREDQTGKSLRLVWLESQFNPNLNMSRTSRSPGTKIDVEMFL